MAATRCPPPPSRGDALRARPTSPRDMSRPRAWVISAAEEEEDDEEEQAKEEYHEERRGEEGKRGGGERREEKNGERRRASVVGEDHTGRLPKNKTTERKQQRRSRQPGSGAVLTRSRWTMRCLRRTLPMKSVAVCRDWKYVLKATSSSSSDGTVGSGGLWYRRLRCARQNLVVSRS